jgi:hypothetical protein
VHHIDITRAETSPERTHHRATTGSISPGDLNARRGKARQEGSVIAHAQNLGINAQWREAGQLCE